MPALLSNRYLLVNKNISLKFSLPSKTTTYFYPNVLQHRYHKETASPPQILSPTLFSFNDWQKNPLSALHNHSHECKISTNAHKTDVVVLFFPIASTQKTRTRTQHPFSQLILRLKIAQVCVPICDIEKTVTRHVRCCRTETIVIALLAFFHL